MDRIELHYFKISDKLHQIDPNGKMENIQWSALFIPLLGLLGLCILIPFARRVECQENMQ